ncbi:MAG: hypothetical protein ABI992_03530 [Chthoniobacterales bacterium]
MRKRANPDSEPNIRRIDSKARATKQTHGFQVHVLRGSTVVTRMFSDTVYGGKESARKAARKFKRSTVSDLPDRVFRGPAAAKKGRGAKSLPAKKTAKKSAKKAAKSAKSRKR